MVGDEVLHHFKPEIGYSRQHPALAGHRIRKDNVEGGNPVGGDDQHMIGVHGIDVPDLAAAGKSQAFNL